MKSYPRWFIKRHKTCVRVLAGGQEGFHRCRDRLIEVDCDSKWVEVWAFENPDGNLIGPIGVCPKCKEMVEIETELEKAGYPK